MCLLGLLGLEALLGKYTPGTKSPCLKDSVPAELMGGKLPINKAEWGAGAHNLVMWMSFVTLNLKLFFFFWWC